MKITSYKEKYERKKYAYTSLLNGYNELVETFNDTKKTIINTLKNYKCDGDSDYDVGYNTALEHAIAVIEDMNVPLIFEVEKPQLILTRLEYELLKYWSKKYNYIAIDKDGALYTYRDKPSKNDDVWSTEYGRARRQKGFDDLFHFVQWEDLEPTSIQEVLENCEVVESD